MSIPQDKFNDDIKRFSHIFKKLSDKEREQAIDFAEFLYERKKKAWRNALECVPEEDEELSTEELEALQEAESDNSEPIEDVAKELGLKWI